MVKVAAACVAGVGAAVGIAACGSGGGAKADDGPMSDVTRGLMDQLKPRANSLDVRTQAVRQAGSGAYDGTRLLQAADAHAYGTPAIGDPTQDVKGDGKATFNEVRQVVRGFDANANDALESAELRAFEGTVGIRWVPAGS